MTAQSPAGTVLSRAIGKTRASHFEKVSLSFSQRAMGRTDYCANQGELAECLFDGSVLAV